MLVVCDFCYIKVIYIKILKYFLVDDVVKKYGSVVDILDVNYGIEF